MKTRFERELSGELGPYWKTTAEKQLSKIREDLDSGKITIDEFGIARNSIGRIVMDDLLEMLRMVTDKVDTEATIAARTAYEQASIEGYRRKHCSPTEEDSHEIREEFGDDAVIVNVLTGGKIHL